MTARDDIALVKDMLEAARSAVSAVEGRERDALVADHVRTLGLVKCVEIIGEAAGRLSIDIRERHPEIPWAQIIGMRNRLVHDYFDIDYDQVWLALTEDLPHLISLLERMLSGEAGNKSEG